MFAERINSLKLDITRKVHDDGKLYGAIASNEIVSLLAEQGINISKNQVLFNKSIKTSGKHNVTIKLTSQLKPQLELTVSPEAVTTNQ